MEIKTLSRLGRFRDIVVILVRYGFVDILERLDLPSGLVPKRLEQASQESTWVRIRKALEELGPTFIKVGQILSLRTDLIPLALARELSHLQDNVPPEPYENILMQVHESLGSPVNELFSTFEEQPLAAASLAQVHRAQLHAHGEVVAVKVRRPGIRKVVDRDLAILDTLARQLDERIEELRIYDLPRLVSEIRRSLLQELDFVREARNMRIARANFQSWESIVIPAVYEDLGSDAVLVMELVRGAKLRDLEELGEQERERIGSAGLRVTLKQILEDGFFHADPHPGNLLILKGGRFCLLDWGMTGRLTTPTRFKLVDLFQAVIDKDASLALDVMLELSPHGGPHDRTSLEREILDLLDTYHSVSLKNMRIGPLLLDFMTVMRDHGVSIRSDLAMMAKALVTGEGFARQVHPELNVVAEAEPYVKRLAAKRFGAKQLWTSWRRGFRDAGAMLRSLPRQLGEITEKVSRDRLTIRFRHSNLQGLQQTMERTASRLTLGVVTAAMIIGSSMIISTGSGPMLLGYPALGLVGYVLSALFGLWLVVDIIRNRNR